MIYEYKCCGEVFEVVKRLAEFDRPEDCPKCGEVARRIISRTSFYGADDWDKAQYCPGLGQVVKSDKHRRQIAKSKGLEEVGNEDMNKIAKGWDADRRRAEEKRLDEACQDAFNHGFGT